jgi:hypothetical protein
MVLLATITATAGDMSETFSAIPQTYSSLELDIHAADSGNTSEPAYLTFDGVGSNCYSYQFIGWYSGASNYSGNSLAVSPMQIGYWTGVNYSASANSNSQFVIKILGYAVSQNTTATWTSMTASAVINTLIGSGSTTGGACWSGNPSVTSLTISTGGSGFVAGGTFKLYGIR